MWINTAPGDQDVKTKDTEYSKTSLYRPFTGGSRFTEFPIIGGRYGTFNFGFLKSRSIYGSGRSVEVVGMRGFAVYI